MPYKLYWDGLKFGMLLQLAVGPMCLMVFNTAKNAGFWVAFSLVLSITLVDGFYIVLATLGASKLLEKPSVKKAFRYVGGGVLILFGLNTLLSAFDISLIPGIDLQMNSASVFLQGLLLTLSNPITIVFWGSVLTNKIVKDDLKKSELTVFSIGLISATLFFLSAVAVLGTILSSFLPSVVSKGLNILVGLLISFFGVKMLARKEK